MTQLNAPPVRSSPSTPAARPNAVVDYNARPAPARGSWLNVRVLLFVLVFGAIIGTPLYMYFDMAINHGIKLRSDGYTEVDLKAMSVFPLDQENGRTEDVPERFRALDGKKVILVGEMWAPNSSGDYVGGFDLVYSIAKCCFSGPPQAQHFVKSLPAVRGAGLPLYSGLVRVKGTLKVDVTHDGGKVNAVYHVAVDSLDPV